MEKTNDGKKGGWLVGKRHYDKSGNPIGGIPAVVGDSKRPVELEGGEVIINREASKKYWRELSKINQSAGNGVPIKPQDVGADEDPEEYKEGGKVIEFNPNRLPNKRIYNYAKNIKQKYPKVWDLGGNIFGNEAFKNLERVINRGYWTENEEWMYIKWRSFVARHKQDYRIAGVIAMLKWVDSVDKGWAYMKNLIEEEIEKRYPKKKKGGGVITYKNKYNKKYGYDKNESHDLKEISKDTGVSKKGLQQIYNKGVGAFNTNPQSVRPNVKSEEQWAMARVYSAVMGGKAARVDAKELKMETGGKIVLDNITQYIDNDKKCYTKTYSYKNSSISVDYCEGEFFKINTITTKESNRRNGDATKLVDYVKNRAKESGFSTIEIYLPIDKKTTRPEYSLKDYNKAVSFYKKNGFEFYQNSSVKMFFNLNKMETGGNLYHLGGDMSKHLAPNGKPSNLTHEQWHLVRTPEFKAWFGDWENDPANASKVIDENGEPLVVFHGSKKTFFTFKKKKNISNKNPNYVSGFWFFSDPIGQSLSLEDKEYFYEKDTAKFMAENWVEDSEGRNISKVLKCFLNVRNPIEVDSYAEFLHFYKDENVIKKIKNSQRDGWFIHGSTTDGGAYRDDINVFKSNQIKLADGSNTTFDESNPDIRYEGGGRTFYTRTYADGTIQEFSVEDYEKNILPNLSKIADGNNPDIRFENGGELAKGIKTEQEHRKTLEKIASGKLSVDQAIKNTAKDHLKENPKYYTELAKIENKKYADGGDVTDLKDGDIIRVITDLNGIKVPLNYRLSISGGYAINLLTGDQVNNNKILKNFQLVSNTTAQTTAQTTAKKTKQTKVQGNKFNIGDKVRIINIGKRYSKFKELFEEMGFINKELNRSGNNGDEGEVFGIGEDGRGRIVYGVNLNSSQVLISEDGLELVNQQPKTKQQPKETKSQIPSTDKSTWNNTFEVGDTVKVRFDYSNDLGNGASGVDYNSTENSFKIIKVLNINQIKRAENQSGKIYRLSDGKQWEGKDLELIQKAEPKQIVQQQTKKLQPLNVDFMPFLNNFIQNQFESAKEINEDSIKEQSINNLLKNIKQSKDSSLKGYEKYLTKFKKD